MRMRPGGRHCAQESERRSVMNPKETADACLIVSIENPTHFGDPMIIVSLNSRSGERDDRGEEHPIAPIIVNGYETDNGQLCLIAFGRQGEPLNVSNDPEYRELRFVDHWKIGRCARTLAKIKTRLQKIYEKRGAARSWPEH